MGYPHDTGIHRQKKNLDQWADVGRRSLSDFGEQGKRQWWKDSAENLAPPVGLVCSRLPTWLDYVRSSSRSSYTPPRPCRLLTLPAEERTRGRNWQGVCSLTTYMRVSSTPRLLTVATSERDIASHTTAAVRSPPRDSPVWWAWTCRCRCRRTCCWTACYAAVYYRWQLHVLTPHRLRAPVAWDGSDR